MIAAANVLAYCAQVTALILLCAGLPRLLRFTSPSAQHAFWRLLLLVCVALPLVQPWRTQVVTLVSALASLPPADSAAPAGFSFSSIAVTLPFDVVHVA